MPELPDPVARRLARRGAEPGDGEPAPEPMAGFVEALERRLVAAAEGRGPGRPGRPRRLRWPGRGDRSSWEDRRTGG